MPFTDQMYVTSFSSISYHRNSGNYLGTTRELQENYIDIDKPQLEPVGIELEISRSELNRAAVWANSSF